MHPDQFNVINAKDTNIYKRTVFDLEYHASLPDAMLLDNTLLFIWSLTKMMNISVVNPLYF